MADMELVIKIPEDEYKIIKNCTAPMPWIEHLIKDGTPLPKGHGDLKDIGECDRKLFYQQCGGADSLITVKSAFDMLLALPTILESDKGSEE